MYEDLDTVYVGTRDNNLVDGAIKSAQMYNLPYTLYDKKTFNEKYPSILLQNNEVAMVDHTSALVFPERCIKEFLNDAKQNGAQVFENTKVISYQE